VLPLTGSSLLFAVLHVASYQLAAGFYAAGSLILTLRPPFPVVTIALALLGLGSGLYDASLTTVVAHYENGTLMSAMYSFFGIGAMISPFIIGSLLDQGIKWNVSLVRLLRRVSLSPFVSASFGADCCLSFLSLPHIAIYSLPSFFSLRLVLGTSF